MVFKNYIFKGLSLVSTSFVDVTAKLHDFAHRIDHKICDYVALFYNDEINAASAWDLSEGGDVERESPADRLMTEIKKNEAKNKELIECEGVHSIREQGAIDKEIVLAVLRELGIPAVADEPNEESSSSD